MQYACLVYVDPDAYRRLDEQELTRLDEASVAHDNELRDSGQLILAQAPPAGRRGSDVFASATDACPPRPARSSRQPSTSAASCSSRPVI